MLIHIPSHPCLASKLYRLSSNTSGLISLKKEQFHFHSIPFSKPTWRKISQKTEEQRKCRQQLRCARLMFSEISCRAVQCECSIKSSIQTLSPPPQIDRSIKGLCDVGFLVTCFMLKTWTSEREREGKEQSDCKSSQIKLSISFLYQLNYIVNSFVNT